MLFDIVAKINTVDGIITPCVRNESFEHYRPFVKSCECELCHQNRRRDELIVIRYTDTKEEKVVGTGCLEKAYGHETVKRAFKEAGEREEIMGLPFFSLPYFVNLSYEWIKDNGYCSCQSARETMTTSTITQILNAKVLPTPTADVFEEIKAYYLSILEPTDFEKNVKTLLEETDVSIKGIPLVPALVNAYLNAKAKKAIQAESNFYGSIGERVKGKKQTFKVIRSEQLDPFYCDYGISYNNFIQLETGEVLQWTTGRKIMESETTLEAFTVKKHYESKRFGKVTVITRPKFTK